MKDQSLIIRERSGLYKATEETKKKLSNSRGHRTVHCKLYDVQLLSPDGIIYSPVINAAEFARQHGLERTSFIDLLNGKKKVFKGWILIE